jgi:hypothetical protein
MLEILQLKNEFERLRNISKIPSKSRHQSYSRYVRGPILGGMF